MLKKVLISNLDPYSSYGTSLSLALINNNPNTLIYGEKTCKTVKQSKNVKHVWSKNAKYAFQILSELNKDKPEIVHVQHELNVYGPPITILIFPLFLLAIKLLGFKLVVTVHALPKLSEIDKEFIESFTKSLNVPVGLFKFCFAIFYKYIQFIADKIIVHTKLIHDVYVKEYGANSKKISVFSIGVPNLIEYTPKHEHFFFYMGYMVKRKGIDVMLEGFKKFVETNPKSDFELVITGAPIKGQEFAREEVLNLIKSFDKKVQDKIKILGFVEQPQIDKNFKNCYAVCLPSKMSIAASGPLSLALSYGKCCLASKVGNLAEEVEDGVDGLSIAPNSNAWEQAFTKVSKDLSLVKKLEAGAIKKAEERNWDIIAKKHLHLYDTV